MDNYVCKSCNKIAEYADLRYIINIKISDDTATTTCAIFNEVAQRLLGNKSVSTMLEEEGYSGTIPDAIRNLCGTTLIFRLKLTSRNLQECMENYKVNWTFVPNNQLEKEYSNDRAEENILDNQGQGHYTDLHVSKYQEETTIYQEKRKEGKSRKRSKENVTWVDSRKRKKNCS